MRMCAVVSSRTQAEAGLPGSVDFVPRGGATGPRGDEHAASELVVGSPGEGLLAGRGHLDFWWVKLFKRTFVVVVAVVLVEFVRIVSEEGGFVVCACVIVCYPVWSRGGRVPFLSLASSQCFFLLLLGSFSLPLSPW